MRIAQIAPLFEAVPPKLYGGTERVVHWITEAFVEQGHDVTLFASGDSETSARLVPVWPQALRLSPIADWVATYALLIETVAQRAHELVSPPATLARSSLRGGTEPSAFTTQSSADASS